MSHLFKCVHCDFVDYRSGEPTKCPECGSPTKKLESPFKDEKITYKVTNVANKVLDSEVSFENTERSIDAIIGKSLDESIPNEYIRHRVIFMIKAYAWMLIKKNPQLWSELNMLISGMIQILTLKIEGPKK